MQDAESSPPTDVPVTRLDVQPATVPILCAGPGFLALAQQLLPVVFAPGVSSSRGATVCTATGGDG